MAAAGSLAGRTPAQQEDDLWAEIGLLLEMIMSAEQMSCFRAARAYRVMLRSRLARVDALRAERAGLS